jgi:hypothetical protein
MAPTERPFALPPDGKIERTMTQNSPFSVRVERAGKKFGEAMNEIRSWLDRHKIQPTRFKSDIQEFEINFAREDEARLFARTFSREARTG